MKLRYSIVAIVIAIIIGVVVFAQIQLRKTADKTLLTADAVRERNAEQANAQNDIVDLKQITVQLQVPGDEDFTFNTPAQNALEALMLAADEKKLTVSTNNAQYGTIVNGVGKFMRSSTVSWKYTVNGKKGMIAPDRYVVHPGDVVEWKYE